MTLDYQEIVSIVAQCMKLALPIGLVFGIGGKSVDMFLSMALGKERVKL